MTDTLPGTPLSRKGDTIGAREDLDRGNILGLSTAFPRSGSVIIQPGRAEFAVAAAGMVAAASMISI